VAVSISPEAEDAVTEALTVIFGQAPAVYHDIEKHTVVAFCFVGNVRPGHRHELRAALANIRAAGLNLGPGRISMSRVRRENWAESWKRHFTPIEVSSRLLILPSWSKRKPRRGQALVILDPGLSFGTGHHPTTRFCLRMLSALRTASGGHGFLDIGTGSGILVISAVKLGYAPVEAFDFDGDAVRVATQNARVNGIRPSIRQRDLTRLSLRAKRRYGVICANLIYDLLLQERRRILNRLAPGGTLVVAGILKEQFEIVRKSYEGEGMRLVAEQVKGEWHSGAFQFR
jgi:ribosomal protein L11 methyltransferase